LGFCIFFNRVQIGLYIVIVWRKLCPLDTRSLRCRSNNLTKVGCEL